MTAKPSRSRQYGKAAARNMHLRHAVFLLIIITYTFQDNAFARGNTPACSDGQIDSIKSTTPSVLKLLPGTDVVSSKQERILSSEDTVVVSRGGPLAVDDTLLKSPVTSIYSIPSGAEVFIDSISLGRTPIDSIIIRPGKHFLKLRLTDYQDKSLWFEFQPDKDQTLSITLLPDFGFVSVSVSPVDSRVVIDSGDAVIGSVTNSRLSVGWHTMLVSHAANDKILQSHFYLLPANSKVFEADLQGFSYAAAIRSAIVPGVGQILDGDVLKGSIELVSALSSGYLVYDSQRALPRRIADFRNAQSAYSSAATEDQAVAARNMLIRTSSDLTNSKKYVKMAFTALVATYMLTLADALIFNSTMHDLTLKSDVQLPPSQWGKHDSSKAIQMGIQFHF